MQVRRCGNLKTMQDGYRCGELDEAEAEECGVLVENLCLWDPREENHLYEGMKRTRIGMPVETGAGVSNEPGWDQGQTETTDSEDMSV